MIDHVTIRVSDFEASKAFYTCVLALLGHELGWEDAKLRIAEWGDFSIAQDGRPMSRDVHIAFVAKSRAEVDAFHGAAMEARDKDNGLPGLRPHYHEGYYAAYLLDPDGNNIEAVHHGDPLLGEEMFDHLKLRVPSLDESRRFYETIAPTCGFALVRADEELIRFRSVAEGSWLYLADGRATQNVHIAFSGPDRLVVDDFHKRAIEAGYRDNGPPGERPIYHEGYYGAYVLDPNDNNIEAVFHNR